VEVGRKARFLRGLINAAFDTDGVDEVFPTVGDVL